jgi:hypothetical protein
MSFAKHIPLWTPGCGRPHPDAELIKTWAEGKITLVEKQRITHDGVKYGQPLRVQYPCWNPDDWKFDVAVNSQMVLDLSENLMSIKKTPKNDKLFKVDRGQKLIQSR